MFWRVVAGGEIERGEFLPLQAGGIGEGFGLNGEAGEFGCFEILTRGEAAAGGPGAQAALPLLAFKHIDEQAIGAGADAGFHLHAMADDGFALAVQHAAQGDLLDEGSGLLHRPVPSFAKLYGIGVPPQPVGGLHAHPHTLGSGADRAAIGKPHDELMLPRGSPPIMARPDGDGGEGEMLVHGSIYNLFGAKCKMSVELAKLISDSSHFGRRGWRSEAARTRPTARLCRRPRELAQSWQT